MLRTRAFKSHKRPSPLVGRILNSLRAGGRTIGAAAGDAAIRRSIGDGTLPCGLSLGAGRDGGRLALNTPTRIIASTPRLSRERLGVWVGAIGVPATNKHIAPKLGPRGLVGSVAGAVVDSEEVD